MVTVSSVTMPDEPEFIGQTEASRPVEIRSQVTGILKERFLLRGATSSEATGCIKSIRFRSKRP